MILESNGLHWNSEKMENADADSLDASCILALIMGAIRADISGAPLSYFRDGCILEWLKRLKTIDDIGFLAQESPT